MGRKAEEEEADSWKQNKDDRGVIKTLQGLKENQDDPVSVTEPFKTPAQVTGSLLHHIKGSLKELHEETC